jgi:UDP-N-acetylmuramoyl-L-alanyl-D-glutamate--2,6-diaminopimelate ligase
MISHLKKAVRSRISRRHLNALHKLRAVSASTLAGFPVRGMLAIGITGTKGKTTTCHYVSSILEEAGYKVAMATTVNFQIGDKRWVNESNKSVLPPHQLQAFIKEAKAAHCDVLIVEVTSHALEQHRVWGIPFRFAGFTNLGHDHLDYHGTMEAYRDAKAKLFRWKTLRAISSNADDEIGQYMLGHTKAPRRWSYSMLTSEVIPPATDHVWADKISANSSSASFTIHAGDEDGRVRLKLPGRFNIENALCAATLCMNLNMKLGTIIAGLERLERVPGRLEKIETKKGFSVLIDYAHTPDSLEKLYGTLRPDVRGRMIAILGATGDRDKTKRPIMGALAARFCDYVIVTDEESYSEDPAAIIDEVAKGVPRGRTLFKPNRPEPKPIFKQQSTDGENEWWWKIPDRRAAIDFALSLCRMDDLVLVTGMGAQTSKVVNGEKVRWNEREIIEELLAKRNLL